MKLYDVTRVTSRRIESLDNDNPPPPPAQFTGIVALDTPQQNNPCQLYIGSPPATEMQNKQILHNERKADNQDSNPRPYSHAVLASSHHNRKLPLNLGRVKNVMKGYCPPTSMGLPITLSPPIFSI